MIQYSKSRLPYLVVAATSLIVGALSTIGCAHPLTRRLEGRWLGHAVENFDDGEMALATGWARGTSFEFSGSRLTVTVPAEDPRVGTFKVESAHGGDFTLAIEDGQGRRSRSRFTFDQDHLVRWHLDEARSIVLRREQL
jgi:hypothetical protein